MTFDGVKINHNYVTYSRKKVSSNDIDHPNAAITHYPSTIR